MKKYIYLSVIVALVVACTPPTAAGTDLPENIPLQPTAAIPPTLTPIPPYVYDLPQEYAEIFSGSEWEQDPVLPQDFMIGHAFMDFYATEYQVYEETTLASMQESGAGWAAFNNFWSYSSLEPPVIVPLGETGGFRDATDEEICNLIDTAHGHDLKFALVMGLNSDVALGDFVSWEHARAFAEEFNRIIFEKSANLSANSEWWDDWFEAYEAFAVDQAQIAQQCNADMLVIGMSIDGAVVPGNADRWRGLISNVRNSYSGPLSYGSFTNENFSEADAFPYDSLDYIAVYLWSNVSMVDAPTIPDLVTSFERFNDRQFEPLSRRFDKPIIFLTPFQSRDHGAQQVWFEPGMSSTDVGEDLLIQAMMYEAFFQAIQDEEWVAGVWTWGYWWRDDFDTQWTPGDSMFNKSSSVRNKPAVRIFEKWSEGIAPTP